MNQVLNQEEIDALLSNPVDAENSSTQNVNPGVPTECDLTNHVNVIKGRISGLELINERFSRNVKLCLYNFLKKSVEVSFKGLSVINTSEYISSLSFPTSINFVKMNPLKGNSIFVVESNLVYSLVENFFGGEGKLTFKGENKEFTPTEHRVVKLLLDYFFSELKLAWSAILDVQYEYKSTEVNPAMINPVSPAEVLIVSKFNIELDGGGGDFSICLPYSMLEPIKGLLELGAKTDIEKIDENWEKTIFNELLDAPVELDCVLTQKKLSLREVMRFKEGDIVTIEIPEEIILSAKGIPLFVSTFGTFEGKYALKIVNRVKKSDEVGNATRKSKSK